MPYTKGNPPDAIKGLPKKAQEIWISAFNAAYKAYAALKRKGKVKADNKEAYANSTAWAAVKRAGYKKRDGKWVKEGAIMNISKLRKKIKKIKPEIVRFAQIAECHQVCIWGHICYEWKVDTISSNYPAGRFKDNICHILNGTRIGVVRNKKRYGD